MMVILDMRMNKDIFTFNHVAQFARACDQSLVHGKFAFKTTMPAKVYANMTQTLGDAAIGPSAALYVQKQ